VNITPSCACEYSVTISGNTFEGAGPVTVFYSFDVTANGQTSTVQNVINTNADSSGSFSVTIDHNSLGTACGDSIAFSNPTTSLKFNGGPIEITGGTVNFFPETLFCGPPPPPPPGKTFDIGPSSMEGHLLIRPGDWISGGYSFKFVKGWASRLNGDYHEHTDNAIQVLRWEHGPIHHQSRYAEHHGAGGKYRLAADRRREQRVVVGWIGAGAERLRRRERHGQQQGRDLRVDGLAEPRQRGAAKLALQVS